METKASLSVELEGIHREVLHTFKVWEDNDNVIPDIDFTTDAKGSSVTSGRFILLELDLQTEVSHIYAVIERAIGYRTNLLPPRMSYSPSPYLEIFERFKDTLHHLEERIPQLLEALEAKGSD